MQMTVCPFSTPPPSVLLTFARVDKRDQWMRTILPIGALFSGSLILSNFAYLSLSVSFIQMLKVRAIPNVVLMLSAHCQSFRQAFTPVAILLISFACAILRKRPWRSRTRSSEHSQGDQHGLVARKLGRMQLTQTISMSRRLASWIRNANEMSKMISFGCAMAAYGELHFEMIGFIAQCAAVGFEASRLGNGAKQSGPSAARDRWN
jgi:hypothetical protein